jgi:hypothetical protein
MKVVDCSILNRVSNENSTFLETNENLNLFNELNFEITADIQNQIDTSAKSINK